MNDLKAWLHIDTIDVEILNAKKKGILKKYVEYTISSTRFKSQVCRRYNDFVALYEQLTLRYPYRLVPKLPPPTINALFSGVDSNFVEARRRALKRWLILISSHTVLNSDPAFKFFLTYMNTNDHAAKMKEDYEQSPVEYITNPRSGEFEVTNDMIARINSSKPQLDIIGVCINELASFLERSIAWKKEEASNAQRIAKDLKILTNESYFTTNQFENFNHLREVIPMVSQNIADIAEKKKKYILDMETRALETIMLLKDMLNCYKEMNFRKDRELLHHQIVSIRRRKLSESSSQTEEAKKQDRLFNDVDQIRAFSTNCLLEENERIFKFIDLLGNVLAELSGIESSEMSDIRKDWLKMKETTIKFSSISI